MFKGYTIIVAYSGKKAEKTKEAMAEYNRLSEEAASAVKFLNAINSTDFNLLRDFFQEYSHKERARKAWDQLSKKDRRLAERAFQFFKEEELIQSAIMCLKEEDVIKYGRLMSISHELSLTYLKNIVPEIDYLQKTALLLGACGASGFGGGFGGSCYAVVQNSQVSDFIVQWSRKYGKKFPHYRDHARFDIYPACSGNYWEILNG
jgi:galactokinase